MSISAASRGCLACIKHILKDNNNVGLLTCANTLGALPVHIAAANGEEGKLIKAKTRRCTSSPRSDG